MTQSLFAPPPPPRPAGLPGIDISSIQDPALCDYAKIAAQGIRWAMVRVTEGNAPDAAAARHRAGLQAHGVAVGPYPFGRPRHPALEMADLALRQIDGAHWEIPLALDLESEDKEDYLPPDALEAWALTFLERVEAVTGRRPWLYSGPGFVAKALPARHSLGAYPLWCANYNARLSLPRGWDRAVAWQYTNELVTPGFPRPIDASVLLVPLDSVTVPPPRDTAPTLDPADLHDR